MECVTSVSYSFLINGSPQGQVIPTRGLRQGDQLSPYLFIMCTEVLSGLCTKAQNEGKLPGVRVSRNSPMVNHLLFADDTMFFTKSDPESCRNLAHILQQYESISGQSINLTKSSITFSSKTPRRARNRAMRQLRIRTEGGTGKYLGLPENFGRRKRDIFASILDRIRQKAHSWSSRFLSHAGKQVLLKSVLSAMPSYTMSCFKLPVSLCKQIQSLLTRFWWDDKPDKRKMSWVSWEKLTFPKNAGGLGFRDIENFNDSLLAKIGWRLVSDPESLLARVLLGKYCHQSSFMECSIPSNPSHGWRSIMAGRDVLSRGLGWNIGDGHHVKIWSDAWLSPHQPERPIGPAPLQGKDLTVSSLIHSDTNKWNVEAIRCILPGYEKTICSIPLSTTKRKNRLIWLPVKKGIYTTRTGYGILTAPETSPQARVFNWQANIWKRRTSPKIKSFLWKAAVGALPVASNLLRRGIEIDPLCKRCGLPETTTHVLAECPFAQQVWSQSPLSSPPKPRYDSTFDLLQDAKTAASLPPAGLGGACLSPWILWNLWKARNTLVFDDKSFSAIEIITKSCTEARKWQAAQEELPPPCKPHQQQALGEPSTGTSCYVDAAWNAQSQTCGMGWLCREHGTSRESASTATKLHVSSPLAAEAWALRDAIIYLLDKDCMEAHFFSDSLTLVNLINSGDFHSEIDAILCDIKELRSCFSVSSVSFVPRLRNTQADFLVELLPA